MKSLQDVIWDGADSIPDNETNGIDEGTMGKFTCIACCIPFPIVPLNQNKAFFFGSCKVNC